MPFRVETETLLDWYRHGIFPMADARDDPEVFLIDPDRRGVMPLERFKVPARLARTIKRAPFRVTFDEAFSAVIDACALEHDGRPVTWINDTIIDVFNRLHAQGHAHSVECWRGDELVGGLYGLHMGGVFFGESMFSRATDASKIALVALAARLKANGFVLLDAQFYNPHLTQFGLVEISRIDFKKWLKTALAINARF
jgi:leucyl/phenylalanyl-tRNA---protein transferase